MPSLELRTEALERLKVYEDQTGKVDEQTVLKEIFIQSYSTEKRLDQGVKKFEEIDKVTDGLKDGQDEIKAKLNRCPVIRGEKEFHEVHSPPKTKDKNLDNGTTITIQSKMKSGAFLSAVKWFLILIVGLLTGGSAVYWLHP